MKNQDLPGEWNNIDERKKIRRIKHVIYKTNCPYVRFTRQILKERDNSLLKLK